MNKNNKHVSNKNTLNGRYHSHEHENNNKNKSQYKFKGKYRISFNLYDIH